jgi:hypothetical protein
MTRAVLSLITCCLLTTPALAEEGIHMHGQLDDHPVACRVNLEAGEVQVTYRGARWTGVAEERTGSVLRFVLTPVHSNSAATVLEGVGGGDPAGTRMRDLVFAVNTRADPLEGAFLRDNEFVGGVHVPPQRTRRTTPSVFAAVDDVCSRVVQGVTDFVRTGVQEYLAFCQRGGRVLDMRLGEPAPTVEEQLEALNAELPGLSDEEIDARMQRILGDEAKRRVYANGRD